MGKVLSVSPFSCRMWPFHERLEEHINESSCRELIESFEAHGQRIPALGRPVRKDCGVDVELIYGARRLFAARHLNRHLLVEIKELSDRDAIVAMDIENRQRADISAYERAQSYLAYLRSGQFTTQRDIASALKVSSSHVSRMLKLAKLPSVVVAAFGNPLDICEVWGLHLANAMEDPRRRQLILDRARALVVSPERASPRSIYRRLTKPSTGVRPAARPARDEVVAGPDGNLLFRIRYTQKAVVFMLPQEALTHNSMAQIRTAMSAILTGPGTHRRNVVQETLLVGRDESSAEEHCVGMQ
jgi:ParB family transcriptional regulator, chromosome partitioning protein